MQRQQQHLCFLFLSTVFALLSRHQSYETLDFCCKASCILWHSPYKVGAKVPLYFCTSETVAVAGTSASWSNAENIAEQTFCDAIVSVTEMMCYYVEARSVGSPLIWHGATLWGLAVHWSRHCLLLGRHCLCAEWLRHGCPRKHAG